MALDERVDPRFRQRLEGHGLVLYDGDCGFCQYWVQFILDRDPQGYFLFAPLQSVWTKPLHGRQGSLEYESVLLYESGQIYGKSGAALRIAAKLKFPWNLVRIFSLVPGILRDSIYDAIARRRHQFGFSNQCRLPLPEERARFLYD